MNITLVDVKRKGQTEGLGIGVGVEGFGVGRRTEVPVLRDLD